MIGLNLFDNPLLPQGLKDKLKAGAPIDMSFNYDSTVWMAIILLLVPVLLV